MIGQRYRPLFINTRWTCFGIETTIACFQTSGTFPQLQEELIMRVNGSASLQKIYLYSQNIYCILMQNKHKQNLLVKKTLLFTYPVSFWLVKRVNV